MGGDPQQQAALRELLAPLVPAAPAPPATDQPDTPAAAVCPACRRFFTWAGLGLDRDGHRLTCADCRTANAARAGVRRRLAVLTLPGFYVALLGLLAAGLWLAGAGNPAPARLQRQDQQRAWQRQQYPRLACHQAKRARLRAAALAAQGQPAPAGRWAALAEQAFRAGADAWAATPAAPDLQAGAALMRAARGDPGPAHDALVALAGQYGETDPSHRSYLYHRGRVALLAGRSAAGQQDLEAVLSAGRNQPADLLAVASQLSGNEHRLQADPDTFRLRQQTRAAAGLDLADGVVFESALALLAQYRLPSAVAAAIEQERRRPVSVPPPRPAPGHLTIEEFP